jgi:tetratricopeptide (TPR) repeat protein
MAIFKCKICGGDIQVEIGAAFGTCDSCQTTSTLPKANEERIVNLFNRANHFRRLNEFDKAMATYENILNEDGNNAEAHWGVVLCRYGIEYVEDPKTGKRVPTCHRTQLAPILSDADYMAAVKSSADGYAKNLYEEEAKVISEIQKRILAIANNEEPFDVFICYKETTNGGSRTVDSTLAQDIYYQLTNDGFKVFFSRITLEDRLGTEYEPYIFNALNTAKVMLAIGTKKEYFEAVWVKNEWSRFLSIMKNDRSRLLIPCYRDMDAYDMPDELASLQSQDMSKIGFIQDLIRGVKKVLEASTTIPQPSTAPAPAPVAPGVESLMKRGWITLEDNKWKEATEFFDRVLDIDPEYAPAYTGRLCASVQASSEEDLVKQTKPFDDHVEYKKAIRFADDAYRVKLENYAKFVKNEAQYKSLVLTKQIVSNDIIQFGGYRWIWLEYKSGKALLISAEILAKGQQECSYFLNYEFKDTITKEDKELIDGDIFLLDDNEAGRYFRDDDDRATTFKGSKDSWWLRSRSRRHSDYGALIASNGGIYNDGNNITVLRDNNDGIRPALWVNLEAAYIKPIQSTAMPRKDSSLALSLLEQLSYNFSLLGEHKDSCKLSDDCKKAMNATKQRVEDARHKAEETRKQEEARRKAEEERKRREEQQRQEAERKRIEQSNRWAEQGLCRHCGGQIGGLFTKKCKVCGKIK